MYILCVHVYIYFIFVYVSAAVCDMELHFPWGILPKELIKSKNMFVNDSMSQSATLTLIYTNVNVEDEPGISFVLIGLFGHFGCQ